jgi:hypothetical protein
MYASDGWISCCSAGATGVCGRVISVSAYGAADPLNRVHIVPQGDPSGAEQ